MIKKLLFASRLFSILVFVLLSNFSFGQNSGFENGKVRLKLKQDIELVVSSKFKATPNSFGIVETGVSKLDILNKEFSVVNMKRVFPNAGKHESKHVKHGLHLWYELDLDRNTDINVVTERFKLSGTVLTAEPVSIIVLGDSPVVEAGLASTQEGLPTNDPYLADQWHYHNTGEEEGYSEGSDINLYDAWKETSGSNNVIVAIVDGGIDVGHSDLKANIWVNEAELYGEEGVDDDNNGYIDDINGYNFVDNKGQIIAHEHGTHVAGTVAAVNNNGIGVAGVAGGSGNGDGAKLMSCQIFTDAGNGNYAEAIIYGADNGAVISQNSWGYQQDGVYDQIVLDAIDYFNEEAGNYSESPMKGGVVFFAAGNSGIEGLHYPGYYENTVAVSATGTTFRRAPYSNYGTWVDVTAPGGDMTFGARAMILSTTTGDGYGYMQGTSMACPHVSGIAALVVSKYGSDLFTNVDLKTRIITSGRNIDDSNPSDIGKLGSGLIDAAAALQINESTPPEAVTDLTILGTSKDFAVAQWTVPADVDDETPSKFLLFASDSIITQENILSLEYTVVDNSTRELGDIVIAEALRLEENTSYYFAVLASDKWGNISEISNIVSGQTNSGPVIATEVTDIEKTVSVLDPESSNGVFTLYNQGEGVLNWELDHRHYFSNASVFSVEYPENFSVTNPTIEAKLERVDGEKKPENVIPLPSLMWENQTKRYYNNTYPSYFIGELDSTNTNSSATKFVVDDEDGFNLTRVHATLRGDEEDGNFIIEVYKGESMLKENLIYSDNEHPSLSSNSENMASLRIIGLTEGLFFEKGETFWIVFHSPSGNLFPFGIYPGIDDSKSSNCLYSSDMGKTWSSLTSAIESPSFVWAVTAESHLDPWYDYVTVTPEEGQIFGQGESEISYAVDASRLVNGVYYSNMVFKSNDEENPFHRVNLRTVVRDHKPVLNTPSIIDCGNEFRGLSTTATIDIRNVGFGAFVAAAVNSSNPQFKVVSNVSVPGRSDSNIQIEFTPESAGSHNSVISLESTNGDLYSFNVFGVGLDPAVIDIKQTDFTYDNVTVGDIITDTIVVRNTGSYPLQYGLSGYGDLSHIEDVNLSGSSNLGYTYETVQYPEAYVFNDVSETGTDITDFFKSGGLYYDLNLGFEFPFFGKSYDIIKVTPQGLLSFNFAGGLGNAFTYNSYSPDGYIAGLRMRYPIIAITGKVYVKHELGKVIVQYSNFRSSNDNDDVNITFQIVMFDNGNISFVYDKMDGLDSSLQDDYYVAIENEIKTGGLFIQGRKDEDIKAPTKGGTIINIYSPGVKLIKNVENASGIVSVGDSVNVVFTLDETKLNEGSFTERLNIFANDTYSVANAIEVNVNVTSGGTAILNSNKNTISFGDVLHNKEVSDVVEISNSGDKPIDIISVTSLNSDSQYIGELPVTIKPRQVLYARVVLNSDVVKSINDVLEFTASDNSSIPIAIDANILEAPELALSVTEITDTLEVDQIKVHKVSAINNGKSPLEIAFGSSTVLNVEGTSTENTPSEIPEFTYIVKSTYNSSDVPFIWYNLSEENKFEIQHDIRKYWDEYDLPFAFEFYGEEYSKIYVSISGVVSFDKPERDDVWMFPTVPVFGEDNHVNNAIAPFFSGQDFSLTPGTGVYYRQYDDKLVIEWRDMSSAYGGAPPFSFQLVLQKDGRIRFMYNRYTDESEGRLDVRLGQIGIKNKDASEKIIIAAYDHYFKPGVSVEITPSYKYTVDAGQSKEFDFVLNTNQVYAGDYDNVLNIFTNDPLNEKLDFNLHLHVAGDPLLVSDTVDYGVVMPGVYSQGIVKDIVISNDGKRPLEVTGFQLEHNKDIKVEYLVKGNFWTRDEWVLITPSTTDVPVYSINTESTWSGKIRLTLNPVREEYLTVDYTNNLIIETNYGEGTFNLPIRADYKRPPVFKLDKDSIYNLITTDDVVTDEFRIGNRYGKSDLKYQIEIDYTRDEVALSSIVPFSANAELMSADVTNMSTVPYSSNEETFYNVLSYENNTVADTRLGFGGAYTFSAATAFTAPDEGFKLSHVQTWYVAGTLLNADIQIEIRTGSDIASAKVVHTQTVSNSVDAEDDTGSLLTFELSEPIVLLPYERFYVVFTYPIEAEYPLGVAEIKNSDLYKTFFVFDGQSWIDLKATDFKEYHYMVRAAQKEYESMQWLELSNAEGIVNPGERETINITMYPDRVAYAQNEVKLNISTNDPVNPEGDVKVILRRNQSPALELTDELKVLEGDTLRAEIKVVDVEGDAISHVKFNKEYKQASISYENGILSFEYRPDFDSQGDNEFEINTRDALGIEGVQTFNVEVYNVNRAPVVVDDSSIQLNYENPIYKTSGYKIFNDPDGQEMTFTTSVDDESIARMYLAGDNIIIEPLKVGFTRFHITAVDEEGEANSVTKTVVVNNVLGMDDLLAHKWEIYPNPVADDLIISLHGLDDKLITVNIYDVSGAVVKSFTSDVNNKELRKSVKELNSGIYMVELIGEEGKSINKMIKQ
ncbi:MAG: S8 family serine peptidase [Bacteroidota bacterium]